MAVFVSFLPPSYFFVAFYSSHVFLVPIFRRILFRRLVLLILLRDSWSIYSARLDCRIFRRILFACFRLSSFAILFATLPRFFRLFCRFYSLHVLVPHFSSQFGPRFRIPPSRFFVAILCILPCPAFFLHFISASFVILLRILLIFRRCSYVLPCHFGGLVFAYPPSSILFAYFAPFLPVHFSSHFVLTTSCLVISAASFSLIPPSSILCLLCPVSSVHFFFAFCSNVLPCHFGGRFRLSFFVDSFCLLCPVSSVHFFVAFFFTIISDSFAYLFFPFCCALFFLVFRRCYVRGVGQLVIRLSLVLGNLFLLRFCLIKGHVVGNTIKYMAFHTDRPLCDFSGHQLPKQRKQTSRQNRTGEIRHCVGMKSNARLDCCTTSPPQACRVSPQPRHKWPTEHAVVM